MYWKLTALTRAPAGPAGGEGAAPAGRFVLHRHQDTQGAHLDLRLETDNGLRGWRIEAEQLEPGAWATWKQPHPAAWLDYDGEAVRCDEGSYVWHVNEPETRELALHGKTGIAVLRFERRAPATPACLRAVDALIEQHTLKADHIAGLIEDGLAARRNAVARYCGLGRELDGAAFDEAGWRALFESKSLREIGDHLAALEVRYDRQRPPQPVSRPEALDAATDAAEQRRERALRVLRP